MKRAGWLALAGAGLAVGLAAAAVVRAARTPQVPLLVVEAGAFQRAVLAEGMLRAVRSTPISTPAELRQPLKIAWLLPEGSFVRQGDVVTRLDSAEPEKALRESEASLAQVDRRLAKTAARAESGRRTLARNSTLAGRDLEEARSFQSTDSEIYSRYEIATSAIDTALAESRKTHADAVLVTRPEVDAAEVGLLGIDRRRAEQERRRAADTLAHLELRAPHDGLFLLVRNWRGEAPKVGDMAWNNEKLAEIPDLQTMEAEVYVLEADAGGLAPGQTATVSLEGHPGAGYRARLRHLDALAQPRQQGSSVQYFGGVLELERTDVEVMKPGVRVTARIVVADRPSVLVVPRQAIFEREGKRVVLRRQRWGGFAEVPVEIEAVAPERVIVVKGVTAGDVIALADPQRSAATVPPPTAGPAMGGPS